MTYIVETITDVKTVTRSIGQVKKGTRLTVSDPCYLDDDYSGPLRYNTPNYLAAVSMGQLAPGEWVAYADMADMGPGGFGGMRVVRSGITLKHVPTFATTTQEVQGVDAGMVGYFIGSPFLNYEDTWTSYIGKGEAGMARLITRDGGKAWVTDSGFGDGAYPVTVFTHDGLIVAVETCFIAQGDDDE